MILGRIWPPRCHFSFLRPSLLINGTEAEEGKRKPPRSARGEARPSEAPSPEGPSMSPALPHAPRLGGVSTGSRLTQVGPAWSWGSVPQPGVPRELGGAEAIVAWPESWSPRLAG